MGDRFDGALAAGISASVVCGDLSIPAALQSLSLHETLIATGFDNGNNNDDDSNKLTLFRAVQNSFHGGVMYTSQQVDWHGAPLIDAIKQSQMTSMLSDTSRCSKYATAISHVITTLSTNSNSDDESNNIHVLDIGTGTGLLAMLAAKSGAKHVDAVEMFEPLANVAKKVVSDNNLQDIITVHAKRSTDLQISQRANVLVTEIFDSALLGEACLPVIAHAKQHLLRSTTNNGGNPTVIPAKASMYARVVSSKFMHRFHFLGDEFPLHRSANGHACDGGVTPIPMHLDALNEGEDYIYLTDTFKVFDFDFSDWSELQEHYLLKTLRPTRIEDGIPHAVVSWWVLDLLGDGNLTYSTAPDAKEDWQDHWLQIIHPLPHSSSSSTWESQNDSFILSVMYDDLSVRCTLGQVEKKEDIVKACSCGWHAIPGGPYRIFELGDPDRLDHLSLMIKKAIAISKKRKHGQNSAPIRCIDISDGAVCSLLAAAEVGRGSKGNDTKTSCASIDVGIESSGKGEGDDDGGVSGGVEVDIVTADDDEVSSFVHAQVARKLGSNLASVNSEFEPVYAVVQRELEAKNNCVINNSIDLNTYNNINKKTKDDVETKTKRQTEKQDEIDKTEEVEKGEGEERWMPFDMIMSEPYTRAMHRYPLATLGNLVVLRRVLSDVVREGCISVPGQAKIFGQLIRFEEDVVRKAFGRVGVVQGIDHRAFDKLWANGHDLYNNNEDNVGNRNGNDDGMDTTTTQFRQRVSLPLFQYRTAAVSARTCLREIEMNDLDESILERRRRTKVRVTSELSQESKKEVDALSLWVVYDDFIESRVQRCELLILDKGERQTLASTGTLEVCNRWDMATSTWDVNIENREPSRVK